MSDESLDTQSSQINLNLKFPTYGQSLHKSKASQTRVRFQWNLHWIHRQKTVLRVRGTETQWSYIFIGTKLIIYHLQPSHIFLSCLFGLTIIFITPTPNFRRVHYQSNRFTMKIYLSIYLSIYLHNPEIIGFQNWVVCFYYLGKLFSGN